MSEQKKWIISEIFKDDRTSEISAHPNNWVKNNLLFWPNDKNKHTLKIKLKNCVEPKKRWKSYLKFCNFRGWTSFW